MVKVSIPPARPTGHSWAKLVTGVDRSKTNGFAFQGQFLPRGRLAELPVGALILVFDEIEVRRRVFRPHVKVLRVQENGELVVAEDKEGPLSVEGPDWALLLRDRVAALLDGASADDRPLAQVPTGDLARELVRREDAGRALLRAMIDALRGGGKAEAERVARLAMDLLLAQYDLEAIRDAALKKGGENA